MHAVRGLDAPQPGSGLACSQNEGTRDVPAMLATLGGILALMAGLSLLLLPLLATELSRPRDSAWGAVVLLLGLVLVTTADRLTGAPMLAVLCGGLLIGRLGTEVGQARWCQLSPEERQRLWSAERWRSSFEQLAASMARLLQLGTDLARGLGGWIEARRQPRTSSKRWVRPEPPESTSADPKPGDPAPDPDSDPVPDPEIGRASCRERVSTWV